MTSEPPKMGKPEKGTGTMGSVTTDGELSDQETPITQKAEFLGGQGEKLAAALELPSGPPRAFALFAHCFSCSKDIKAAREIARALRSCGYAVLRFDFTGLGASEGDFANTNFSSNVEDLISAADYLRRDFSAPALLIGHSLGGAAAIVAAGQIPEVKGVVTIGAPAEAAHVVQHIGEKRSEIEEKGAATVTLAGRPFTIKKQFLEDLEQDRVGVAAATLDKPYLIMHAPLDQTVGVENATKLFIAAKHPKSFVSLDTADHLLSNAEDAQYAAQVIAAWAERFLPPVESSAPLQSSALPPFSDGAAAQTIPGRALAVALSVDGHPMTIDASQAEGGDNLGPNPTRTVEAALAACAVMTMRMYANRKGWDVSAMRVEVVRAVGEDAHVARTLQKTLFLEGDLTDDQRQRLKEIADKCPVHRMVTEGVRVTSSLG